MRVNEVMRAAVLAGAAVLTFGGGQAAAMPAPVERVNAQCTVESFEDGSERHTCGTQVYVRDAETGLIRVAMPL